jgi:hypothetical protein
MAADRAHGHRRRRDITERADGALHHRLGGPQRLLLLGLVPGVGDRVAGPHARHHLVHGQDGERDLLDHGVVDRPLQGALRAVRTIDADKDSGHVTAPSDGIIRHYVSDRAYARDGFARDMGYHQPRLALRSAVT